MNFYGLLSNFSYCCNIYSYYLRIFINSRKKKGTKQSLQVVSTKVKKRTYNTVLKKAEIESLKYRRYATNTNRKSRWAFTAHVDWRNDVIQKEGAEFCDSCVLNSDLLKPKELKVEEFCSAMCRLVTEVRKYNSKDYPPQSLKGMVTAIQFYLHSNLVYWQLLPKLGGPLWIYIMY